jgi:excisionase family DNA binding protein
MALPDSAAASREEEASAEKAVQAPAEGPPSIPEVLTVDELAALLRLNRKTVYDALARGEIPGARRIGATYRILRAAVLDWFASGQARVSRKRLR